MANDFGKFAEQMDGHGYGLRIRFETDAQGEPLVHRVDGQHTARHYTYNTVNKVIDEIDPVFDLEANVYYITIDNGEETLRTGEVLVGGVGSRWSKNGGWFLARRLSARLPTSWATPLAYGTISATIPM